MADYSFLTTWMLRTTKIEPVFEALFDHEAWPRWWPGVVRVVSHGGGDARGVGRRSTIVWRSFLPYEIAFESETLRIDRPHLLEGSAKGELTGTGCWRVFESEGVVAVTYEWNVAASKQWMHFLTPAFRPAFKWNHDYVMRAGGRGLAGLLGVELVASA